MTAVARSEFTAISDGAAPGRSSELQCGVCGGHALQARTALVDRAVCAVCGAHRICAIGEHPDLQ